nr:immunoglobulin light chain junction region [Macaca mulatta]MPO13932.1 immunoglobulin light chain junction region [Macaca mulatta]
CMVWHNNVYIF